MAEGATVQNLHEQLTFDVGARYKRPDEASLTLTGAGSMTRELYLGDSVTVRVTNARGEIISEARGHVVDLGFKVHPEKLDKEGEVKTAEFVERKHKIKLGDDE